MSTTITETEMSSKATRHTATRTDAGWLVTWLPGRTLTQSQAITAMTIAETLAAHDVIADPLHTGHHLWPHIDQWAAELGISGPRAVALATMPAEDCAQLGGGQGDAIAEAPRANRHGSRCPAWCDIDHAKVNQYTGKVIDKHISAAMASGMDLPRVILVQHDDESPQIELQGMHGFVFTSPEMADHLAGLVESLAGCTSERLRGLADEIRYAASILTGGAK